MKIMFMDESGDHSLDKIDNSYPVFVLSGCIFDADYYRAVAEPLARKLKNKHFGHEKLVFRSYDIRKQKGDFACLVDKNIRMGFYTDMDSLIDSLDFVIISAVINKKAFRKRYINPQNPYELCLRFILERSVMYLGKTTESLMFRIESRETHNDRILAKVFDDFVNNDQRLFSKEEVQNKLTDLSFNQKVQNILGMQIADLIAYPIGRWVLDRTVENKAFTIIEKKFHKDPKTGSYLNYGLKIFP